MQRLELIHNHLKPNKTANLPKKSGDDIVICAALRSPLTKAKRGGLRDTPSERLIAELMKAVFKQTGLDPKNLQDITLGNVLQPGSGFIIARMAQFLAGVPHDVPINTTNRLCSSGLEAIAQVASKIRMGYLDIGLAGGFENMTHYDMDSVVAGDRLDEEVFEVENARNCMMSMGVTSENVATKFNITREEADRMGVESQRKALNAQEKGLFKDEIVPIKTFIKKTDKDGNETKEAVVIDKDDGCRATTYESLAKLKPAFGKNGVSTAGNSSQTTDGAAMVLVARRSTAEKLKLPILARWISYAVAGVPPDVMGIGPAFAIPVALEQAKLKVSDIDIFELNEAFATQAVYCAKKLNIPFEKVNPKGGAIALGHPLGCTGSRLMASLLPELKRTGGKLGVISMCIGTGMGAAAVVERE
jgi:acetyl-CoA acyltransferase 1